MKVQIVDTAVDIRGHFLYIKSYTKFYVKNKDDDLLG